MGMLYLISFSESVLGFPAISVFKFLISVFPTTYYLLGFLFFSSFFSFYLFYTLAESKCWQALPGISAQKLLHGGLKSRAPSTVKKFEK